MGKRKAEKQEPFGPSRTWRTFHAPQMGAFVAAVLRGATMEEAAREAKVAVATLYYRRRTCPPFAAAWAEAAAASAGPLLVFGAGARRWQLVRARRLRPFCRARKQAFLDRFAESCNLRGAAAASGCSPGTVYRHLRMDGAFAAGFEAALEEGYARLEAEAVRARVAAQEAYRLSADADPAAAAHEFERTMQLLREYKRGHGKIGRRPTDRRLTKWSFDEAMEALEKRLRAFGVRIEEEEGEEAGNPARHAPATNPSTSLGTNG